MKIEIRTKRIYDSTLQSEGTRVLVDKLWPRGISREKAALDDWWKDLAPSDELRKWFNHDPERWGEFKSRYFGELDSQKEKLTQRLESIDTSKPLCLLFAARDQEHNNAVALKEFMESRADLT